MHILSFYKNKEIREAIIDAAKNREIAIKFEKGFGKRPDVLIYPDEILDLIKQGATSFHSSEELWTNPRMVSSEMKLNEIKKLRVGWDLILDIDSPFWNIAKITAWLIIQGLKDFGIASISIKFSGNKGFHIGVPFEAFPEKFKDNYTKDMFPEAPRNIASYILDYISKKYISVKSNNEIVFGTDKRKFKISYQKLREYTNKDISELTTKVCSKCSNPIEENQAKKSFQFLCSKCSFLFDTEEELQFKKCDKCDILMEKIESQKSLCSCGSDDFFIKFDPSSLIEVDTVLISSRHLFRMPYSMHEKSGLVSIPFNPEKVLEFEKKFANSKIVKVSKYTFVDRNKVKEEEAKNLLEKAMHFAEQKNEYSEKSSKSFEALEEAIPEVLFPPCMKKILSGLEDGKKRAIFILINFLKCVGWPYDEIEKRLREWNEKNPDPLKEQIINGQIKYHKRNKENILPPNCDNKAYYKDFQVCMPDSFCKRIKNPVNYTILKSKIGNKKK